MYSPQFYDNEKTLRLFCALHKISRIVVGFSGGGGSGCIDYIFISPDNNKGDIRIAVWPPRKKDWETQQPESRVLTELIDFIHDHVDEALENTKVDWYNNEGGRGHWICVPNMGVEFRIDMHCHESETSHFESRPLGKSAEEEDEEAV
jgi:hypothetical protein